jgi:hypothetical protein
MNDEQFEWESSTKQAWGCFAGCLKKRADTRGGILGHRHQNVGKIQVDKRHIILHINLAMRMKKSDG